MSEPWREGCGSQTAKGRQTGESRIPGRGFRERTEDAHTLLNGRLAASATTEDVFFSPSRRARTCHLNWKNAEAAWAPYVARPSPSSSRAQFARHGFFSDFLNNYLLISSCFANLVALSKARVRRREEKDVREREARGVGDDEVGGMRMGLANMTSPCASCVGVRTGLAFLPIIGLLDFRGPIDKDAESSSFKADNIP